MLVILNSAIFLMFAFSFFKPQTGRDWRTFGAFAAFVVALLGEKGDPHFGVLHIASYVFLGLGFYLLSAAWNVLYHAQRANRLATTGPYGRIRHPQYVAFVMILLGFLLQWPTLLTLVMFPILVAMYGRLAVTEEREMRERFGAEFDAYAARTPRFVPALGGRASAA
jgi:protein-S-isoprenylcysteine O-methyltransferase Ste14